MIGNLRGLLYCIVMRAAHRFNWHYAPPIYPDGDKLLWCKWCGFREVVTYRPRVKDGSRRGPFNNCTVNFGESPWVHEPPTGYTSGLMSKRTHSEEATGDPTTC